MPSSLRGPFLRWLKASCLHTLHHPKQRLSPWGVWGFTGRHVPADPYDVPGITSKVVGQYHLLLWGFRIYLVVRRRQLPFRMEPTFIGSRERWLGKMFNPSTGLIPQISVALLYAGAAPSLLISQGREWPHPKEDLVWIWHAFQTRCTRRYQRCTAHLRAPQQTQVNVLFYYTLLCASTISCSHLLRWVWAKPLVCRGWMSAPAPSWAESPQTHLGVFSEAEQRGWLQTEFLTRTGWMLEGRLWHLISFSVRLLLGSDNKNASDCPQWSCSYTKHHSHASFYRKEHE